MSHNLSGKVAIVGYGEADPRKVPGRTCFEFCAEAARAAIHDAGISLSEIDGVFTAYTTVEPYPFFSAALCEYFGIQPKMHAALQTSGSVYGQMLFHAMLSIATGVCKTALVIHGDNRSSGVTRESLVANFSQGAGHPDYENPYGPLVPSGYALAAQRHMFEYGTKPEHLAAIAVAHRQHALANPMALMKKPISIEDVMASKPISDPLRMLDCCLVSDFGGALILTSAERAKDMRNRPVFVLGAGESITHEYVSQAPDLTTTGAVQSGRDAFAMAGVKPSEMDFAQLYDCFTITVLILLEDLGFCKKGEGGSFVEGGERISLGGALPVNTYGGLLSSSNGGIMHFVEATRQLRGDAGVRQVPSAKLGLVHAQGGVLASHCSVVLGVE